VPRNKLTRVDGTVKLIYQDGPRVKRERQTESKQDSANTPVAASVGTKRSRDARTAGKKDSAKPSKRRVTSAAAASAQDGNGESAPTAVGANTAADDDDHDDEHDEDDDDDDDDDDDSGSDAGDSDEEETGLLYSAHLQPPKPSPCSLKFQIQPLAAPPFTWEVKLPPSSDLTCCGHRSTAGAPAAAADRVAVLVGMCDSFKNSIPRDQLRQMTVRPLLRISGSAVSAAAGGSPAAAAAPSNTLDDSTTHAEFDCMGSLSKEACECFLRIALSVFWYACTVLGTEDVDAADADDDAHVERWQGAVDPADGRFRFNLDRHKYLSCPGDVHVIACTDDAASTPNDGVSDLVMAGDGSAARASRTRTRATAGHERVEPISVRVQASDAVEAKVCMLLTLISDSTNGRASSIGLMCSWLDDHVCR